MTGTAIAENSRLLYACPREAEPLPFQDLQIPASSLTMEEELGRGNFGSVMKGMWNNRVPVAIKMLTNEQMSTEDFLDEARTMHRLRHRKLVQLVGVCIEENEIYIVTELMDKGALRDYLRADNGQTLSIAAVVNMAAQVRVCKWRAFCKRKFKW